MTNYKKEAIANFAAPSSQSAPDAKAEQIAKTALDLLNCVNGLPIDTDAATAATLTAFDRTRSRLQKALAALAAPSQASPSTSIDTPEFRWLAEFWAGKYHSSFSMVREGYKEAWSAMIAHVDAHLARPAPATEPAPDAANAGGLMAQRKAMFQAFSECVSAESMLPQEIADRLLAARPAAADAPDAAAVRNAALDEANDDELPGIIRAAITSAAAPTGAPE